MLQQFILCDHVAGIRKQYLEDGKRLGRQFRPLVSPIQYAETGVESIADGMTETLIGRLSRVASIRVRPRAATFRYKGSDLEPQALGRALAVDQLLTGRLTRQGDNFMLFLSLIDVASGYQTWGRQYDTKAGDLVALQSIVTRDIAENLPEIAAGTDSGVFARSTSNNGAYVAYLKGRHQLNRKTEDALRKAVEHFNEAVALDASFAAAYAGLADTYNQMGLWVMHPPEDVFPKAKAYAEKALSLDPDSAEAHTALGLARFYYDWDFAGAEAEFNRAISDNPSYTLARESRAILIYESDPKRLDEAMNELASVREIDPVSLSAYFWRGAIYYFEGRHDLALKELYEVQSIDPNYTLGLGLMGAVYREQGLNEPYVDHWLRATALEGSGLSESEIADLRRVFAASGQPAYDIAYAELLQRKSREKYVPPVFIAMHYAVAGSNDLAIEWLDRALAERSSWLVELRVDPAWKGLRQDPRFTAVLQKVGFPGV